MKQAFKKILAPAKSIVLRSLYVKKKLKCFLQQSKSSYKKHNKQFNDVNSLDNHIKIYKKFETENHFNSPECKYDDLLNKHPNIRHTAIDIGCGAGWLSAKLSTQFQKVIAIEPSNTGIKFAKKIFPKNKFPNIKYIVGLAEKKLTKINLSHPSFFVTGCVFSHLTDKTVKDICSIINQIAPKDSILAFAECWGKESHDFMWHIRTQEWWQKALPEWKLDFHGPSIQNIAERHKGFHGVKIN
jgi:SAM-dependent methyltransferase